MIDSHAKISLNEVAFGSSVFADSLGRTSVSEHDAAQRNPVGATHSFGVNTTKPITHKPTSTSGGPHTASTIRSGGAARRRST